MRWFKHFTDNHRGQSVQTLLDDMGYFGPFFYYLIYELCAEKLEQEESTSLSPDSCQFTFHQRVVCSASRAKPSTVLRALDAGQSCGLWSFELDGVYIKISLPILLNLLDRDMKKPRLKREKSAPKMRLDKSRIEESRVDKNIPKAQSEANKELNRKVWDAYSQSYFDRYKTEPVRNASVNAKISQLAKRLGVEAIDVVKFYLGHNDTFYLKNLHSIGLCLTHAESLRTQWARGKAITNRDVKNFEKSQEWRDMKKDYEEGGF